MRSLLTDSTVITLAIEMLRDDEWKPIQIEASKRGDLRNVGPHVSVDGEGRITITYRVGYVHPPWRVRNGDEIVFERAT